MSFKLSKIDLAGRQKAVFRPAVAYPRLWSEDQRRLQRVITETRLSHGRSLTFPLQLPLLLEDQLFMGLRCKGISPQPDEFKRLPPHQGDGLDRAPIQIDPAGQLFAVSPQYEPEGTALLEKAELELRTATELGTELADLPIGYGEYPELNYNGKPVGFSIFAIQGIDDLRFYRDLIFPKINNSPYPFQRSLQEAWPEISPLARLFGQTLRTLHRRGYAHGYPHLDNLGLHKTSDWQMMIRDLETVMNLGEMTPEQRTGYLLADLQVVLSRLSQTRTDGNSFFNLSLLIPDFFKGYFGTELAKALDPAASLDILLPFQQARGKMAQGRDLKINLASWAAKSNPSVRSIYQALRDQDNML